jgi:hypothetical protein
MISYIRVAELRTLKASKKWVKRNPRNYRRRYVVRAAARGTVFSPEQTRRK